MWIPAGIAEARRRILILTKETRLQCQELAQNGQGVHHHEHLQQEQGLHADGHQESHHGGEHAKLEDDGYQSHLQAAYLAKRTTL